MFHSRVKLAAWNAGRSVITAQKNFATASSVSSTAGNHRVVVIGCGTAGLAISHQLLRSANLPKMTLLLSTRRHGITTSPDGLWSAVVSKPKRSCEAR
ncbi:hypothetical protein V1517DRAFT_326688 [Lipomyces orientalis]|uniref:Uncharacterized protein n=1 Tax=Lipomyces orientalis TaxID=1233043 RepID=A0ACC3TJH4_9ASCO